MNCLTGEIPNLFPSVRACIDHLSAELPKIVLL